MSDNHIDLNNNSYSEKELDNYINDLNSNSQKVIATMKELDGKTTEELIKIYNTGVVTKQE